jgi:hypothetical protein
MTKITSRKSDKKRRQKILAALLVTGVFAATAGLALLPSDKSGASVSVDLREDPLVATGSLTTASLAASSPADTTTYSVVTTEPHLATVTTTTVYQHPVEHPSRIVVPAMGLDATMVEVGVLENGDMEVPPFGLVGWYRLGPAPGASGPAVIVGHVDTKSGPDVFYHLRDLKPGDEVLVYGTHGDAATFAVDSKEQQLKSDLPTDRIWSNTKKPVLRLITCGGDFDRRSGHYLSNVIVYGHLVR